MPTSPHDRGSARVGDFWRPPNPPPSIRVRDRPAIDSYRPRASSDRRHQIYGQNRPSSRALLDSYRPSDPVSDLALSPQRGRVHRPSIAAGNALPPKGDFYRPLPIGSRGRVIPAQRSQRPQLLSPRNASNPSTVSLPRAATIPTHISTTNVVTSGQPLGLGAGYKRGRSQRSSSSPMAGPSNTHLTAETRDPIAAHVLRQAEKSSQQQTSRGRGSRPLTPKRAAISSPGGAGAQVGRQTTPHSEAESYIALFEERSSPKLSGGLQDPNRSGSSPASDHSKAYWQKRVDKAKIDLNEEKQLLDLRSAGQGISNVGRQGRTLR